MMDLNMTSPLFLLKLLLPQFRERASKGSKSGIINVASQAAHTPIFKLATYCATKHFLKGLTLAIGHELIEDMDVLLLNPGPVKTFMSGNSTDPGTVSPQKIAKGALTQLGRERMYTGALEHDIAEYIVTTMMANLPLPTFLTQIQKASAGNMVKIKDIRGDDVAKKEN